MTKSFYINNIKHNAILAALIDDKWQEVQPEQYVAPVSASSRFPVAVWLASGELVIPEHLLLEGDWIYIVKTSRLVAIPRWETTTVLESLSKERMKPSTESTACPVPDPTEDDPYRKKAQTREYMLCRTNSIIYHLDNLQKDFEAVDEPTKARLLREVIRMLRGMEWGTTSPLKL